MSIKAKILSRRRNSRCKVPEVGVSLMCVRDREEVGLERDQRCQWAGLCRATNAIVLLWCLL